MLSIIYIHFIILFLSYWEIQFQYKTIKVFVYVINYKQEKLKKNLK